MKVVKSLEKSQRDFLWEGGRERKMHLVNWEVACRSKAFGDLGIGQLKDRNTALLSKWLWRFSTERESLWHSIIQSKYGCHSNGWDVNPNPNRFMSLVWRNIITLFPLIASHLRFSVGNGNVIHFWKDLWWQDQLLFDSFPRLFRLVCHKDAKVSNVISSSPNGLVWNLPLSRNLYDWEVKGVEKLMSSLNEMFLSPYYEDTRIWDLDPSGFFSSKFVFLLLYKPIPSQYIYPGHLI